MKPGFFLTAIFMVLLFPAALCAGGKITGVVTGFPDGQPLPGANIILAETGQGTVTGADGRYSLNVPRPGKYRVRVTYIGFYSQEKALKILDGQTVNLDFGMKPQIFESREVVITDNRPEQAEQAVPMRMNLITARAITENPGQNIASVLDYVSGVNLSSTMGVFSNSTVVTLRGLSGNDQGRTLVLVDDMPLNKADEGSVNWNLINRDNVEKIEVTKGPGSARYGSSAMGGVINIRTRQPVKPISGTATLGYGTFNTAGFRYSLGGIIGPKKPDTGFFYNLNGFYRRSDGYNAEIPEYLEPGDTFTVNTFLREASIGARLGYRFNAKNSISASADFFNDKRGRGEQIYELDGAYERHNTWQASVRYQGAAKNLSWTLNAFTLNEHFERINEYMSDGEYNLYNVLSNRIDNGITAGITAPAGKHQEINAGVDFHQGSVDGQDIYYTSTDLISNAGKMENYALYAQNAFRFFGNRLQADIGLRLNYAVFHDGLFTVEYPSYSIQYMVPFQDTLIPRHEWFRADPKFSVQYRFNPMNRVYVTIARGFRAPILDDLCRTGKKQNGFKISNPALNPETLDNYETGADLMLFKKLHVAPSVYYSVGHDFMYYISTGDSVNMGYKVVPVFQKRNISRVDIYGAEIDIDIEPARWISLFANWAYAHPTITRFVPANPAVDTNLTGKFLTDVPLHKVTAGMTCTNKIVNVNLLWKFVGPRWINDENGPDPDLKILKYKSYNTFSLRAWHTFYKRMVLSVNVDNLFNVIFVDDRLQRSPGRMFTAEITCNF